MVDTRQKVVLSIAGSDSGGGAGIQADIKTITMLGGYAASAITAITAQNSQGVRQIELLDAGLVCSQIEAVLSDFAVEVIKIGMLGNENIILAAADILSKHKLRIIVDPVMIAKGGAALLLDEAISSLVEKLLPQTYLLTPNIPEAEKLTKISISNIDDQRRAAEILLSLGPKAVLIKGGHMTGEIIYDLLLWENGEAVFESPRINTKHTHGTGCTLSSAIATYLANGLALEEAVRMARKYVQQAIIHAPGLGHGHGPLAHNWPIGTNK